MVFSISQSDRRMFSISSVVRQSSSRRAVSAEAQARRVVWSAEKVVGEIPNGGLTPLDSFEVEVADSDVPRKYLLCAAVAGLAANEWEIYAFPKVSKEAAQFNVKVVDDIGEAELAAALERGERVVLLGAGPFRSLPTMPAMAPGFSSHIANSPDAM